MQSVRNSKTFWTQKNRVHFMEDGSDEARIQVQKYIINSSN